MRKNAWLWFGLIMALVAAACGGGAQPAGQNSSDLYIVVGNSAFRFAGNGSGDGLLLDRFSKESKVNLHVQVANDRDIRDLREQMLAGKVGAPDILIVDDSLDADGLQNVKLIASHKVGVAIRSDVADGLGLQSNTLSYIEFVSLMKSGNISVVASNALAGSASREFFFSTMAWCSNTDAANLTADIVKLDYVQTCGKDVYDFIKSTNGGNEALDIVYNTALGDTAGYNTVITFDSDLLGDSGLNTKLALDGKPVFRFFYFREATAQANVAMGTRDLSDETSKQESASKLTAFLITDIAQEAINLAGFTEGSAALVRHNDTAFKLEWGVASNPSDVQVVNAPISAVASNALLIYRDYYKRQKVVYFFYDTSGSTEQADIVTVDKDGNPETIVRLQAIVRSVEKFTDPNWLVKNKIVPGPKDEFRHFFFATLVSQQVSMSVGTDTFDAGSRITYLLGPTYGQYYFHQTDPSDTEHEYANQRVQANVLASDGVTPYSFGGTAIFDAANFGLNNILASYDPNVDYYIVVLTDGELTEGIPGVVYNFGKPDTEADSFYRNWLLAGKQNISLIGIQFGSDGNSLDTETVTALMNGATYNGNNDQELIEAFKTILGN